MPALPTDVYPYFLELVQNEVAEELAAKLLRVVVAAVPAGQRSDRRAMNQALRDCIARMIPTAQVVLPEPGQPRRIALVGPAGSGKTTTLAKLAAHLKLRLHRPVGLLSLDTGRLAGHEPLRRYADIIRVPLQTVQTETGVTTALERLTGAGCVLIDTPGVGPREPERLSRLASLLRLARPDEVQLVLPAGLAPSAQARAADTFAPLGVSSVTLTHLDEAVGFGVILNAMERLKWGLSYLGTGQNVPQDLQEACSRRVAELILPLQEELAAPQSSGG